MEQLEQFTLGEQIATGDYSMLFEGAGSNGPCAVRLFDQEAVPDTGVERRSFVAALTGLSRLTHPSIVRTHEAGEVEGAICVATELMGCPTLEERLTAGEPLPEKQAMLFLRQAAQALDKGRDVGYCHGNLHAGNVFMVSEEKIKVADFGLRLLVGDPLAFGAAADPGVDDTAVAGEFPGSRSPAINRETMETDFADLARITMQMLGVLEVGGQARAAGREALLSAVNSARSGLTEQSAQVLRNLLTPGTYDSPGELVVDLASAMLLQGQAGRGSEALAAARKAASKSTLEVNVGDEDSSFWDMAPAEDLVALPDEDEDEYEAVPGVVPFYIWDEELSGRFFVVRESSSVVVGRDPACADIVLLDPAISRRHCTISVQDGNVTVEDPESTNGTFVNGKRISSASVGPSDRLRIGKTQVSLSFVPQGR